MEFPPVKHLIGATFDPLNTKETSSVSQPPPIAPQPIAAGAELAEEKNSFSSGFQSGSPGRGVGAFLNAVA